MTLKLCELLTGILVIIYKSMYVCTYMYYVFISWNIQEKLVEADEEGGDIDGGWVDTHHYESKEKKDGGEAALDMDGPAPKDNPPPPPVVQTQEDSDEEALDMEDFEESGMMDDQVINDSLEKRDLQISLKMPSMMAFLMEIWGPLFSMNR